MKRKGTRALIATWLHPETSQIALGIKGMSDAINNSQDCDGSAEITHFNYEDPPNIGDYDFVLFSVSNPLEYPNILMFFDKVAMPYYSSERDLDTPLVIGGGIGFSNPEPMSDFFDIVISGPNYKPLVNIINTTKNVRSRVRNKTHLLERFTDIGKLYIPSMIDFEFASDGTIRQINPQYVFHMEDDYDITKVPISGIFSREEAIFMPDVGCRKNCAFCSLTHFFDYHETDIDELKAEVDRLSKVGITRIKLNSASAIQHSKINDLLEYAKEKGIRVALGSVRLDDVNYDILEKLKENDAISETSYLYKNRKPEHGITMTFGIEFGSDELLHLMNKGITTRQIRDRINRLANNDVTNMGMYFMVGAPCETEEDRNMISELICYTFDQVYAHDGNLYVNINPFIPSPNTSVQRESFRSTEEFESYIKEIRENVEENIGKRNFESNIIFTSLSPGSFVYETATIRSDRRIGKFINTLHKACVVPEKLHDSMAERYLTDLSLPSLSFYRRQINDYETLPWAIVSNKRAEYGEKRFLYRKAEIEGRL